MDDIQLIASNAGLYNGVNHPLARIADDLVNRTNAMLDQVLKIFSFTVRCIFTFLFSFNYA